MKNAPPLPRRIVRSKEEYLSYVKAQNNRTNVYTSVYDFAEFAEKAKIDSSVILDRIFLDFDAHGESIEKAWRDVNVVMTYVIENDYQYTLFFSGRGFHLFVFGEVTDTIRNIQVFFREIKAYLVNRVGSDITLDDRVGQATRLRRIPNTVNMSSRDENGNPYFCIPLLQTDLDKPIDEILKLAKKPRSIPFRKSGNVKVVFPEAPPMQAVSGEISVPKTTGTLPMLPCLHNAIMTENPSHMARAYLVSWYRDLLSGCANVESDADKQKILEAIIDEIRTLVETNEEIWLDWDERETRKHAKFTVYGNYSSPHCTTVLIPNGYCVGKCWRYPEHAEEA
tara:strand:- start:28844 stop:29857 length:1014 start_codon:yes stop_codon:yes gene_type:complete